ncbi:redoxin domain-containing protein [Persicimonas caeni]|uniref:Redoxin domain-containing protein n=1 Tax=Persicimonas caeni TaxID=2292766 RepID=A0A4Y6Q1A4_PERCE|nr:redoxin family protein [Persicimonas caeni]QDG54364.1 redoxin domain-containing protein [Persicimonas caeni]QED35585.1 redoxin domain-containing protein [Persicimonas caeni]
MKCPTRITLLGLLIFLTGAPASLFAQGVESAPTGVEDLAPELRKDKKSKQSSGWLGVMLEAPDDEQGVDVVGVLRSSPAESGGLKIGDRILKVDETAVDSPSDVQKVVRAKSNGHNATVELRRDGKAKTLTIELGSAPSTEQILRNQFVGHAAPAFKAKVVGKEDATVTLAELKGKPVVVDFWATWCGPCRPLSRKLAKLSKKTGESVTFVGLTSEKTEVVERFLASHPHGFAVGTASEKVMQRYLVESYPTVFVLDADGKVAGVFVGLGHIDEIRKLVEKLAAKK